MTRSVIPTTGPQFQRATWDLPLGNMWPPTFVRPPQLPSLQVFWKEPLKTIKFSSSKERVSFTQLLESYAAICSIILLVGCSLRLFSGCEAAVGEDKGGERFLLTREVACDRKSCCNQWFSWDPPVTCALHREYIIIIIIRGPAA